jgi:aminoglycoside/choline kinase family phosphotransferase
VNGYYNDIKKLFRQFYGDEAEVIQPLPPSGSSRQYFRLKKGNFSAIAAFNTDRVENEAFIYITGKLKSAGVNVPELYVQNLDKNIYLIQDLGDVDLFSKVRDDRQHDDTSYINWYRKVIDCMPAIQYKAAQDFDFSICYPRSAFDKGSMLWDLNYFKYYFLKFAYIPFHEQQLEDDFHTLADFLMEAPGNYFLFRDFQSRNIMISNNEIYFIDYQGGRKGALQYDLASLLFEAKTALTTSERETLTKYFINVYKDYQFFDSKIFQKYFPAYALIRILQAFGAYGYRGYFERKTIFLQSIPKAIVNLRWLLNSYDLGVELTHLKEVLSKLVDMPIFNFPELSTGKLTVTIYSFSYKKGIPDDLTGNGGGYVFDCRALPNPGRYDEYRSFTGLDKKVKDFLEEKMEVKNFLKQVKQIIFPSVEDYTLRGFEHLMISFGCTGGQHRSVYCAEYIYTELKNKYNIRLHLVHREINLG